MTDLLDKAIDDQLNQVRKENLQSSIAAGIDANPDQAAKAINYSKALGVPAETAERNLPQIERQQRLETIDYDSLASQTPAVADFLGDPENARAAHDDIDNLRDLELKLTTRWSDYGRAAVAAVPELFAYAGKGTGTALGRISDGFEGKLGQVAPGDTNTAFLMSTVAGVTDVAGEGLKMAGEGLKAVSDYIGPDQDRRNLGTDIFQGLGQVGGQVATVAAAGPAAGVVLMGASGLGYGYEAAERNGQAGTLSADASAALYAGITSLTEKYGLDALMKGIPAPLKTAMVKEIGNVATKLGVSPNGILATMAPKTADVAYGAITEATQEATEGFFQNMVDKYVLSEDKDLLEGLGDQAAAGGGVGGLVRAFVNLAVKGKSRMTVENVKTQADTAAANLSGLINAARAPATAKRMTGRFNDLIAKISGDDELYFGPGAAALYQSMPENERRAVYEAVPGLEEKVQLSIATGSDIQMRKADFLSHIAPLATADQFAEHAKAYPSLYSKAELLDESRVKELEEQISRDAFMEDTSDMAESKRIIAEELSAQIAKTAPYDESQARQVATLAAEYYTNIFGDKAVSTFRDGLRIANETRAIRAVPKTDRDPFLERMRTIAKRQAAEQKNETTDLLGKGKTKRAPSTTTPLINYLISRGGIKRGSPIASELSAIGVDPKRYSRLYKKDGALSDIDNIPANELSGYLEGATSVDEDGNGYASRDWLLNALRDESFGNPILTPEQQARQDEDAQIDELMQLLSQRGVDLTIANNAEINDAIQQIQDEYAANTLVDVDENLSFDIPFQPAEPVGSEAFKKWFKGSKVVDADGNPMVMYHGTAEDIQEFSSPNRAARGLMFFTKDPEFASNYAGSKGGQSAAPNVLPVYVSAKKIHKKMRWSDAQGYGAQYFKDRGYDAVRIIDDGGAETLAVVDPTQVKSVFNRGTFDPKNPNILMQSAYHGSPYKFDKFSLEHLGKGEGNQAFGWGLYFAGNKAIADYYRKVLSGAGTIPVSVKNALKGMDNLGFATPGQALAAIRLQKDEWRKVWDADQESDKESADIIDNYLNEDRNGQLYEVDIPNSDELLDWDKPLSKQPEKVKEGLAQLGFTVDESAIRSYDDALLNALNNNDAAELPDQPRDMTGQEIYQALNLDTGRRRSEFESRFGDDVWGRADKISSLRLNDVGIKGLRYLDAGSRANENGHHNYVIFDDSAVQVLNTLYQGSRGKYRGYISPLEYGRYMIALGKNANRSTMLHEFGHLFLYQMRDGKEQGLIRPEKVKVYDDAVKWFRDHADDVAAEGNRIAKEQGRDITVTAEDVERVLQNNLRGEYPGETYAAIGMQELFARNFEKYLMEGKAPSLALRRAFQSFKAWLVTIYKTLGGLANNLDQDLRDVFDRMLAADEDIEAARSKTEFKPMTAEQYGGTPEAYAAYLQQYDDAIAFAKDDVLRQYLDKLNDEKSKEYRGHLNAVEQEVRDELAQVPVYQAMNGLAEGVLMDDGKTRVKLSKKMLQKAYSWDILTSLSRDKLGTKGFIYTGTGNGISPDAAAELFGYESGDQMLRDILQAKPFEQAIQEETERRVQERYGKPTPDAQAAASAIRNDKRAIMLQAELKAIGLRLGRDMDAQREAEANEAAARIIGRRPFSDAISPQTFLAAERRAAAAAYAALERGQFEKAFDEKRKQIANYYLYKAATDAAYYQEQAFKKLKYTKKPNNKLKGIDGDYADLVRMMMTKIGLRPGKYDPQKAIRQLALIDPIDRMEMSAAEDFVQADMGSDYRDMPFQEFKNAVDAMMNVTKLGRARRKVTIEGEKIDLQAWRRQVADTFRELLGDKARMNAHNSRMNGFRLVKSQMLQAYSWLRRVEYWVSSIEGDDINAPLHRAFRAVKTASLRYRQEEKYWDKRFLEMLRPVKDRFGGESISAPELGGYVFENRGEVIGMLHHIGNESNLSKLINGRRDPDTNEPVWSYEGLQLFIERMAREGVLVKADMDYVQSVWDELERIKPEAQRVHKELYGYRFNEITAQPVVTPWGTYKGGYFPARTDAMIVEDAQLNQDRENLLNNNASFMFPSTGKGFSNSRIESYAAPLDMKANMVVSHVRTVLRFIHLQPAIRNVGRLFNDKALRETIAAVDPHVVKDTIIPWLQRAALQSMEAPSKAPQLLQSFSRWARRRASGAAMFFNVVNTLQQVLGIAPTAHRIGYVNFAKGIATYLRSPVTIHKNIRQLSAEMQQRSTIFEGNARSDAQAILEGKVFTEENGFIKNGMAALGNVAALGDRFTFTLQTGLQMQLDNIAWIAAFNTAVGKGMNDLDATHYADKVVRETQVSNAPEDVARIEHQTAFLRMFTLFAGWFNGMMNLNNSIVSKLARERGTAAAMGIAWAVFNVKIVPYVGGQLVYDFFKGGLPEDDDDDGWVLDDWASYVMLSLAQNSLNELPVAGQIINYGITKYTQKQFNTGIRISPVISTAENVVNSLGSVPEAIWGKGDESKAWRDGLTTFYIMTGIPVTGQVTKSAAFLADVHEGDVKPRTKSDYIKGLLVGSPAK